MASREHAEPREGADVAISYLPEEEADAKEVIVLIEAEGQKAIALPGDIEDEAWCRELVEKTVTGLGGLDILVINAGRQQYREKIEDLSTDDFDKTMKTNLYALHWIAQAAVPHMPAGASASQPSNDASSVTGLRRKLKRRAVPPRLPATGPTPAERPHQQALRPIIRTCDGVC